MCYCSSTIVKQNIKNPKTKKQKTCKTHSIEIRTQEEALKSKPHALQDPVTHIRRSAFPFYYRKQFFTHKKQQQQKLKKSTECLQVTTITSNQNDPHDDNDDDGVGVGNNNNRNRIKNVEDHDQHG